MTEKLTTYELGQLNIQLQASKKRPIKKKKIPLPTNTKALK